MMLVTLMFSYLKQVGNIYGACSHPCVDLAKSNYKKKPHQYDVYLYAIMYTRNLASKFYYYAF